jgi:hypothetical protein
MADMEMIFPAKKVGIKPFPLVNLFITVVTALVSGVLLLLKVRLGLWEGGSAASDEEGDVEGERG